jgi:hypothetical protein
MLIKKKQPILVFKLLVGDFQGNALRYSSGVVVLNFNAMENIFG